MKDSRRPKEGEFSTVRSKTMAAVRSKNTKPEMAVRRGLHARGFRFRLHVDSLPGRPDIVLPKYRAAIFVHGCFWHGHDCGRTSLPATNRSYWVTKIARNIKRDRDTLRALASAEWRTLVIWECAIFGKRALSSDEVIDFVERWLKGFAPSVSLAGRC